MVWMFIQPVVTVAIYAFVFGESGFRSAPPVPGASYVVWLVPGIVPWFFYSEALNAVTNCLQEYNYLVKKVVFQVEVLPLIKLISCLMVHAFFVLIMLGDGDPSYLDTDSLLQLCGFHAGPGHWIFYQLGKCIF